MRNHRIVHQVTWKYMKQNKKRTFTTFFGIVFMVLLMTCVFVGKDSGLSFLEQVASLKDGKWHVSLYDVTKEDLKTVEDIPYVEETGISANYGNTAFPGSGNPSRPYLTVKAYSQSCLDWMNLSLTEGRFPENGNEIVVSESVREDGGRLNIGDTIEAKFFERSITGTDPGTKKTTFPFFGLEVGYGETKSVPQNFPYYGETESFRENETYTGREHTYQVVGFIEKPGFESDSAAGYTAITGLDQSEIDGLSEFNLSIRLNLAQTPENYGVTMLGIAGEREIDFNNYLLSFSGNSSDTTINLIVNFMVVFFVTLIMLASVVLIYNVFNISFQERSRYLGMLSSVGATGRQKRSSIYFEVFVLLVPALPAGILLGMGVVKAGLSVMKPMIGRLMSLEAYVSRAEVIVRVSAGELLWVALVSILTVFISAFLPARKIGKIGPIASIRGNEGGRSRQYRMKLSGIDLLGAEGMLARSTMKRQKKKTRSVVAAMVTFLVVMAVTSFGASIMKNVVRAKLQNAYMMQPNLDRWNYALCENGPKDSAIYESLRDELKGQKGAVSQAEWCDGMFAATTPPESYSEEYWNAYRNIFSLYYRKELSNEEFLEYHGNYDCTVNILGVDDETLKVLAAASGADFEALKDPERAAVLVFDEGDLSTDMIGIYGMEPERFQYYHIEHMMDKKKGESFPLKFYSAETDQETEISAEIVGFLSADQIQEYASIGGPDLYIIVSSNTADRFRSIESGGNLLRTFYFKWEDRDTALLDQIREACANTDERVHLMELHSSKELGDAIVDIINVLLGCFVALTSVICLLNLFNAIRGRMEERRGDFAVMESVGMTEKQMRRMLSLEGIRLLVKSLVLAILFSEPLIACIYVTLSGIFGHITLVLPWGMFAAAAVLAALTMFCITFHSLRKIRSRELLSDIRKESL